MYNYSVAQVLSTRLHIFTKKISNFSLEHLFTFCTRQSAVRTTIAAIVPCNNSQYWMEQIQTRSQRERGDYAPFLHYTCTHIPAVVSRRSSFCRGIIGLYEPDKNTRQRQKSHTSQSLCMHSLTCTCVSLYTRASFSFCFPFPWFFWSCQCSAVSMGEFYRWLMEINGSLWWQVRKREMSRSFRRYESRIHYGVMFLRF